MVARAHLSKAVIRKVSGAPSGGTCAVYADSPEGNVTTLLPVPLYFSPDPANTLLISNPFTFSQGVVDFYLALPIRVNLVVTPTPVPPAVVGNPQTFFAVDVDPAPADIVLGGVGMLADRPAPGLKNYRYFALDTDLEYLDDGVQWNLVGTQPNFDNTFLMMGA